MPPDADSSNRPVLRVAELCASVCRGASHVPVLHNVNLTVRSGCTLAVVGESGCGKSTLALAIMGLLDASRWHKSGTIHVHDRETDKDVNVLGASERIMQRLRGRRMAMIFQDARAALNPVICVGEQLAETLRLHRRLNRRRARQETLRLLHEIAIDAPETVADKFAHQLSGGLAQRVAMAMAMAGEPDVLIADEPTSSLDTPVADRVLDLLADLQRHRGMGVILFTHDLTAVADRADDICVLYAGQIVEQATCEKLFSRPLHPYTRALLACHPATRVSGDERAFPAIRGRMPRPDATPTGCPYHPRCDLSARLARQAPSEYRVRLPHERIDVHSECVIVAGDGGGSPAAATMPLIQAATDHYVACPFWSRQIETSAEFAGRV